jgi:HlyD family secretion protein
MNASADIKTKRVENVIAVPISAVTARIQGSDKSIADKKKEEQRNKPEEGQTEEPKTSGNELEEVVFILQQDGTVKKTVVKSGIQDINHIEIISGLKEGEEIITDPYTAVTRTLKEGTKVKVVAKDKLFEN